MLFTNPFLLLISTVSAANMLTERTAATIRGNLTDIDLELKKLANDTYAWDGTQNHIGPVFTDFYSLIQQLTRLNYSMGQEAPYSCADSNLINGYLANPVEPDNAAAMKALVARRAQFYAAQFQRVVANELNQARTIVQAFFKAYDARVCAASRTQERQLASKIDTELLNTFKQFNTTT